MAIHNPRIPSGTKAVTRVFGFHSPVGSFGTYYVAGYYLAPAAAAALNQAGPLVNLGAANIAYGAHAFLVASGPGAVDAGSCAIEVSGTSVTDGGVRTPADSEVIVADITAMALNQYFETAKKWVGQVTFTLVPAGAAVYSATFNYGLAKYDDFNNRNFTVRGFEVVGRGGANDNNPDFELLFHSSAGWTYDVAAFAPGGTVLCDMQTDYNTEFQIANGVDFAYKRDNLMQTVNGADSQGVVVRITTTANNAIDWSNFAIVVDV